MPERLSFALAMFSVITVVYIAMNHHWEWTTTMVVVLLAVLVSIIVGRFAGLLSARELTKTKANAGKDADSGQPQA